MIEIENHDYSQNRVFTKLDCIAIHRVKQEAFIM